MTHQEQRKETGPELSHVSTFLHDLRGTIWVFRFGEDMELVGNDLLQRSKGKQMIV